MKHSEINSYPLTDKFFMKSLWEHKSIIYYKAEGALARQRLQCKKGKEEGKESKEIGHTDLAI